MAIVVRSTRRASDGGKGGGGLKETLGCDPLDDDAAPTGRGGRLGGQTKSRMTGGNW